MKKKITFIGAGKIVNSIISGLILGKYPAKNITICSPTKKNRSKLVEKYKVNGTSNNISASKKSDIIILAIKPNIVKNICKTLEKKINTEKKIFLTTVVGISINTYRKYFYKNIKLIRTMPNILSSIQKGITALYPTESVLEKEKKIIEKLFKKIGKVIWMKNEEEIDTITTIIGSGPAYFFLFMELMLKKAKKIGLKSKIAKFLIAQTAKNSAVLSLKNLNISFSKFKKNVCSKKGITIAALKEFDKGNFEKIISNVMQAVIDKTKKIKNNFN